MIVHPLLGTLGWRLSNRINIWPGIFGVYLLDILEVSPFEVIAVLNIDTGPVLACGDNKGTARWVGTSSC